MTKSLKYFPTVTFGLLSCSMIYIADMKGTSFLLSKFPHFPMMDKWGHFLMFGIMAFLLNISCSFRSLGKPFFQLGSVIILSFSIIEEFTQLANARRSFDWGDILFDIVGVSIFTLLSLLTQKQFSSARSSIS